MGLPLSVDGECLYVSTGRGQKVFEIDVGKMAITRSVQGGVGPWGIGLSG